jgi:hypothetical protein
MEQFIGQVGFSFQVHGWRKEGGKVKFVDKKADLEIDRHNWPVQKSKFITKKRFGQL